MPGRGRGISPLLKSGVSGGPSFPFTSAFVTTVVGRGGSLTSAEESYLRTFETSVGSDLAEFDRLYIHGLSNNVAARTSFVNPTSTIITAVNNPTFTPNVGYNSNGSTSYLDSNFNPSTQGAKFTQNNASAYIYSLTNNDAIAADFGVVVGPNYLQALIRIFNLYYTYLNDAATDPSISSANSRGLFHALRDSGTTYKKYKNGALIQSLNINSTAIPSNNIYICGSNNNGSANLFTTRQYSLSAFGSKNINQSNFYNAIQALGTSIGWAV